MGQLESNRPGQHAVKADRGVTSRTKLGTADDLNCDIYTLTL